MATHSSTHDVGCDLCGSKNVRFASTATDRNREVSQRAFNVMRCMQCGVCFTVPKLPSEELSRYYPREYYSIESNLALEAAIRPFIQTRVDNIRRFIQSGKLIDVGAGTGMFMKTAREHGFEVEGLELSADAAAFGIATWGLNIKQGNLHESSLPLDCYDVVSLGHVLEHLHAPAEALCQLYGMLKGGGLLVIAVPNADSFQARLFRSHWFHLDVPRHLYHFSPACLKSLVENAGFRIAGINFFSREHNWAGILGSVMKLSRPGESLPHKFVRKVFGVPVTKGLAFLEAAVGRGGTFELYAIKTMNVASAPHTVSRVSIVLLTCNRNDDTIACIRSLNETGDAFEIVLVDNGSQPNPERLFKEHYPDIIFLRNEENLGTPIGNNVGIRYALEHGADYVMMLNNDTTVDKNFLRPLVAAMDADRQISVAGGKIYYYSDPKRVWFAGGKYSRLMSRVEHIGIMKYDQDLPPSPIDIDFLSGCFSLFRASALREVGLLDEQFFAYMEDVDLNVRIKQAGYRLAYIPESCIYHKVSTTIRVDSPFFLYFNMRNRILMLKKHNSFLKQLIAVPYLSFFFGRQIVRLAIKRRYWIGVKAVLYGIQDGLRSYTGRLGKGRLELLHS